MSKKNSKVQFNHKSDNIFIPITPTINQDVQTTLNLSNSSKAILEEIHNKPVEDSTKTNSNLNGYFKESHNLHQEYKDTLLKFESNITDIKIALISLKLSFVNYKSQKGIKNDDEIMINPQNKAINYLQKSSAINGQNLNNPNDKIMKIEYSDGTIYEGQTKSTNIRHGLGKLNFNNLGYFSGEWQNNEMSGFGSLFNESGALIYEGFWEDGNFNGAGVLTNIFHTNKIGLEIDYHDMNKIVDKWVKYEGQFQDNLANGIGKLEFCNGDIFFGNFIANKIEGKGVFIKKMNGDIIGVWKNGFLVEIL